MRVRWRVTGYGLHRESEERPELTEKQDGKEYDGTEFGRQNVKFLMPVRQCRMHLTAHDVPNAGNATDGIIAGLLTNSAMESTNEGPPWTAWQPTSSLEGEYD